MITKDSCEGCMWSKLNNPIPFCLEQQDTDDQSCKYFYVFEPNAQADSLICEKCKKDKDPGKCWWCGER